MADCDICHQWYHRKCENIPSEVFNENKSVEWHSSDYIIVILYIYIIVIITIIYILMSFIIIIFVIIIVLIILFSYFI